MRLLLDTHIILWYALEPERLKPSLVKAIESSRGEIYYSPISCWEIALLHEKGEIKLSTSPEDWFALLVTKTGWSEAQLTAAVAFESRKLATENRDPADRFIAASAKVHDLRLVTVDRKLLALKSVEHVALK